MELALTISAVIGVLLFLIGYLAFVMAGFRHHFVTGIIAALPVLNIVTVPALWHKTSKKLMLSVLGILIVAASWFFGADAKIKKLLFPTTNNNSTLVINNTPMSPVQRGALSSPNNMSETPKHVVGTTSIQQQKNQGFSVRPFANQQRFIDESDMQVLPAKALYKLTFEVIPVNKINTLNGRVVEITLNTQKVFEGKVKNISSSSVFIQSKQSTAIENEFPIANIKQVRLMVKKAIN